jgi:hypothetical protein
MPDPTVTPAASPAASPVAAPVVTPGTPAPLNAAETSFITGGTPPDETTPPAGTPPKTDAAPAAADTPPAKPDAKSDAPPLEANPDDKPATPPVEVPDDPMDTDIPEGWSPKALRAALKRNKIARRDLYQELKALKDAAAQAPAKPAEDPERKALEERLTAADKRRQELEDHMRFLDYTKSEEYQEKYHKPYIETWRDAAERVSELKIINAETGETRQATQDDLSEIVKIANTEMALGAAELLFQTPAKAALVMNLRDAIRKAYTAAERAKVEFQAKGSLKQKEFQEQQTRAAAARTMAFETLNKQAVEKHPELFKPVEGDAEGNALLQCGFEQADMAFSPDLPADKAPLVHSVLRNKAAAFDRVNLFWHREKKAREAAEKKLAEFQKSIPTPGDGGGGTPPVEGDPTMKYIMEHSRPA